ncbi:MAG: hypothetical protein JJU20_13135 [Opitutales bacterium]|nr:hypothetical protein [Opitutales bacterium]
MNTQDKLLRLEPLSSPISDLIASVGKGVAQAQRDLDIAALETIEQIYEGSDKTAAALKEIGYQPTWYQIPEVTAEIKLSMSIEGEHNKPRPTPIAKQPVAAFYKKPAITARATPVDANYSNRFDYQVEASSKISFKIVPIPAPSGVER